MSIFDTGRPTGALGGSAYAEKEQRDFRDSDLNYDQKKAEHEDYKDSEEWRKDNRATDIVRNREERRELPHTTDATIAESQYRVKEIAAQTTLIEPRRRLAYKQIHESMNEMQYDSVARSYAFFQDGLRRKENPQELYKLARQEFVKASGDPREAEKWLNMHGMTPEYTDEAGNAFMSLANYGMNNASHTRAKDLLNREYALRAREATVAARGGKREEVIKVTKDDVDVLGKQFEAHEWFRKLEGDFDEKEGWTKDKGAFLTNVAKLARAKDANPLDGDQNVNYPYYEQVAGEVMDLIHQTATVEGWFTDDFNPRTYLPALNHAYALLDIERQKSYNQGQTVIDVWRSSGPQIKMALLDTGREIAKAQAGAGGGGSTSSQSQVGSVSEVVETPPNEVVTDTTGGAPVVGSDIPSMEAELKQVQAEIQALKKSKGAFADRKGRAGKKRTPEMERLLKKRNTISVELRKARNKENNSRYNRAMSDINASSIYLQPR